MPQSLTRVVDILSYLLHSGSWVCLVFFFISFFFKYILFSFIGLSFLEDPIYFFPSYIIDKNIIIF